MNNVHTLSSVTEEGLNNYPTLLVPGGQVPIVDLMQDPERGEILRHFHSHSNPRALLCHGLIALISDTAGGEAKTGPLILTLLLSFSLDFANAVLGQADHVFVVD